MADSCWYMAKPIQYCKVKKQNKKKYIKNKTKKKKKKQKTDPAIPLLHTLLFYPEQFLSLFIIFSPFIFNMTIDMSVFKIYFCVCVCVCVCVCLSYILGSYLFSSLLSYRWREPDDIKVWSAYFKFLCSESECHKLALCWNITGNMRKTFFFLPCIHTERILLLGEVKKANRVVTEDQIPDAYYYSGL